MMQARDFNLQRYREVWSALNSMLGELERSPGGLSAALHALSAQQADQGFIQDDLRAVQKFRYPHPKATDQFLSAQFNPARSRRFNGAGRPTPPAGATVAHDGCFLCSDNIQWQQRGVELGYEIDVGTRRYISWMNPYPLQPVHAVIATQHHIPQAFGSNGGAGPGLSIDALAEDLVDLAVRLPNWIGFYNGNGAGASIPHHLHFQFFPRPGNSAFPLEIAAAPYAGTDPVVTGAYPLDFAHWRGSADVVAADASDWIRHWHQRECGARILTANIIVTADISGEINLYYVARDAALPRVPEFSGLIGGLEVLGELVFSSQDEGEALATGRVDYDLLWRILRSAHVPLK